MERVLDSYLDQKADFHRYLVGRLGESGAAALARSTGLLEVTARALLDGEFLSWEVVSACLAAAGVDSAEVGQARRRWAAVEHAMWDERGDALRAAFEQNGHAKPARLVEAHQREVPWRRLTARVPVTFRPWVEPTFGTGRRLPDPAAAKDIRDFYALLRELRVWAGSPRQSEIEKRSWGALPDATISAMLQKDRWRTPSDRDLVRVGYFAAACGLPRTEVTRWVEAYERVRHVPPPDDLAMARAEAAELRSKVAAAQAEADKLRKRLIAQTEQAPEDAPAKPDPEEASGARGPWSLRRRRTVAAVAVLVFAAGAGTGAVLGRSGSSAEAPVCFAGTLRLVGSTAFERTAITLRRGYEDLCPDARVSVEAIGSNEGVRVLTRDNAGTAVAMHDGHLRPDSDEIRQRGFRGFPVALVGFAIIVNKDTNVTGLTVQQLKSIYARDSGPTNWRQLPGGANVPIRLVSRTEGSGTRGIFEERLLDEPEPDLSSGDCRRKDEIRASYRIIRCERSSQGQVLDTVNSVPGTIGYAELHVAGDTRRYPNVRVLTLDGRRAGGPPAMGSYPFVAPEVFYTAGLPPNGSPAAAFLTFLAGDDARRILQRAGSSVCVGADAQVVPRCQVT
ncbi:substrate-binding domain-containing protein [Actinomadura terrae]|uniref:substrate-binding domain-containing protein n=1 Tax=Actinomadura terrae TaxID=604353 RepID=UPI001FA7C477|nr:substrate-binding domain-containing protein [Actinomadura terrae]